MATGLCLARGLQTVGSAQVGLGPPYLLAVAILALLVIVPLVLLCPLLLLVNKIRKSLLRGRVGAPARGNGFPDSSG